MTDLERTLAAALRARDAEISASPDAWEQHLDLIARGGATAPGVIRRWRTPVLLAAAVACLAIVGTAVATVGTAGSGTVDPVRATVSSPGPPSPAIPSTVSGPRSTPSTPPSGTGDPRSSGSGPAQTSPASPPTSRPPTQGQPPTSATPPSAPSVTSATPGSIEPPYSGTGTVPGWASTTPMKSDTTTTGPAAVTLSCGSQLPNVAKAADGLTVHAGSTSVIDNSGSSEITVLGVGTVQVDPIGRVSSGIVLDPMAVKAGPVTVVPGGNATVPSLFQPGQACDVAGDPAGSRGGPSAADTTQTVVLIGPDLDHAVAYLTTDSADSTGSTG